MLTRFGIMGKNWTKDMVLVRLQLLINRNIGGFKRSVKTKNGKD